MTALRNAAAAPLLAVALALWFLADRLAVLSKLAGEYAGRIMGSER